MDKFKKGDKVFVVCEACEDMGFYRIEKQVVVEPLKDYIHFEDEDGMYAEPHHMVFKTRQLALTYIVTSLEGAAKEWRNALLEQISVDCSNYL